MEKNTRRRRRQNLGRRDKVSYIEKSVPSNTTMGKNGALSMKETGSINLFCVIIFLSLMILAWPAGSRSVGRTMEKAGARRAGSGTDREPGTGYHDNRPLALTGHVTAFL